MLTEPKVIERNDAALLLREFIHAGDYVPGDRLPAERELIVSLGVSRSILRKGLDELEREGAIWRHVGKGTFVAASTESSAFPNLAQLSNQVTPLQMMRARLAIEPAIAREAAINASAEALVRIRIAHEKAKAASNWEDYEADDDALHRAIAKATGNVLLLSVFDHLNQVRRAVAWRQVIRKTQNVPVDHPSFSEHDLIVEAIDARDPLLAHDTLRDHLNSVTRRLYRDS